MPAKAEDDHVVRCVWLPQVDGTQFDGTATLDVSTNKLTAFLNGVKYSATVVVRDGDVTVFPKASAPVPGVTTGALTPAHVAVRQPGSHHATPRHH